MGLLLAPLAGRAQAPAAKDQAPAAAAGESSAALWSLRSLAEDGNALAQYKLGVRYEEGKGVSRDRPEAAKWYRLSAAQGFADAQAALARMVGDSRAQTGSAWLAAAVAAAGGEGAWASVHAITDVSHMTINMQGQSFAMTGTQSWRFPDHRLSTQRLSFGVIAQGVDGASGWLSGMGQLQDVPKAAEENAMEWERSLWRIFGEAAKVRLSALEAPEVVEGVPYRAAAVEGAKKRDLVVLFAADGNLAGVAYHDDGPGQLGPARVAEMFTAWSAEGALQFPHVLRVLRDGRLFIERRVTSLALNPTLADAIFKKPAK